MNKISLKDLDKNLVEDLAGECAEADVQCYEDLDHAGDAPGARNHIVFIPAASRGGIVYVGSGSSGHTEWTDADSAEDVLRRLLAVEMTG